MVGLDGTTKIIEPRNGWVGRECRDHSLHLHKVLLPILKVNRIKSMLLCDDYKDMLWSEHGGVWC